MLNNCLHACLILVGAVFSWVRPCAVRCHVKGQARLQPYDLHCELAPEVITSHDFLLPVCATHPCSPLLLSDFLLSANLRSMWCSVFADCICVPVLLAWWSILSYTYWSLEGSSSVLRFLCLPCLLSVGLSFTFYELFTYSWCQLS